MTIPLYKITVNSTEVQSDCKYLEVNLRENAVWNATFTLADETAKTFEGNCNLYDTAKIELRHRGSSYTEVLGGYVTTLKPFYSASLGYLCTVKCLGYGVALKRMRVAQEYGTQSANAAVNTMQEILTDAGYGVIPKYVNKVLASATDSGYTIDTTNVYNETTSLRYCFFPYSPADKALKTICDLITAANYPSEGVHWIVKPSSGTAYLCLDVVANHHSPITNVWPTNTDIGTIAQGVEQANVVLNKEEAEANYIVYFGKFEKPTAERWTENNAASSWGASIGAVSDSATCVVGSQSICCTGTGGSFYYPGSGTLGLDVTKFGTERTIPSISFYIRRTSNVTGVTFELTTSAGNYYYYNIFGDMPSADTWYHLTLPVGSYYSQAEYVKNFAWSVNGAPNWNSINYVWFVFTSSAGQSIYVDDLHFNGIVTRGAKSDTAISAQGAKIKLITDSLAKDDSITAADDSGMVGQLAKAELIRSMTTPIVGTVTIPVAESLLPGQIQHIHGEQKSDGTYRVDADFRILEIKHLYSEQLGWLSMLAVTDDVINGYARAPTNSYNELLRAVSPDFQDRNRGDFKARDIDLLQTILEKNY